MSEEWSQGEVSVLIRHGAEFSDDHLAHFFLNRTPSSIKHKRQRLGISKRLMASFDRIGETREVKTPGVIDLADAHAPTADDLPSELTPEQERAQTLMLFLSRLDEYPPETLEMIEDALEIAKRGWVLLHGAA